MVIELNQPFVTNSSVTADGLDRIAFFQAVHEGFRRAEQNIGASINRFYRIGGHTICLRFAGPALIPHITPAIAHLSTEPIEAPAMTICLWDSTSTKTRMPLMVSGLISLLSIHWMELLDIRREIKEFNDSRIRTTFHIGPNILSVLDLQQNLALYWVHDACQIPYYEKGYPLTTLLSWWLESRDLQCVHAAAIGTFRGGVLLSGKGGAGKSTSALACVDSGLGFLADDYCLVATDSSPYAHSLYNTVKLKGEEDIRRFPLFAPLISNADRLNDEKAMIFLQEHYPRKILQGFPVRAVLLPHVTGEKKTRLRKATAGETLKVLVPSTLFQLPGAGQKAFHLMSKLVKQVPCYAIELGTDISEIPKVILSLLK